MSKEVTKEQIGSIVALLVAGKVPFEDAQGFIDKYKDIPSAKKKRKLQDADHYLINVRSILHPTAKNLRGFYDSLDEPWDDQGNPENPGNVPGLHPSLSSIKPKLGRRRAFLKRFDGLMTSDQIVNWAVQNGYRLAFPFEREAFARRYLEDLPQHRGATVEILDLGTRASGLVHYVPLLYNNNYIYTFGAARDEGRHWMPGSTFLLIANS